MIRFPPRSKSLAFALGAGLLLTFAAARCFQPPAFDGPYRCLPDPVHPCGTEDLSLVCDQGICCRMGAEPECPSYVLDGGVCPDGSRATAFYEDMDHDGFGSDSTRRLLCGAPDPDAGLVTQNGDCNDNPAAGGQLVFPGAQEQCDGVDNNCNGDIDEGMPNRKLYYADLDHDGHGDPSVSVLACYPPADYVDTNDDCAPNDGVIYPGAPCSVPGAYGICKPSTFVCSGGAPSCPQTVAAKSTETCNGLDDNCNGQTDEQPGCGGPARLDIDPNVQFSVRHLSLPYNGVPAGCLKSATSASPADGLDLANMIWTGSGSETHIYVAESKSGTWDLSLPNTMLRLDFTYSVSSSNSTTFWAQYNQPVVMICGPNNTYVRLVHSGSLMPSGAPSGTVDNLVDVHGASNSWVVGNGSTSPVDTVLKQAKWIEVLAQPQGTCGTCAAPSFTIDFVRANTGFVKQ